MLSPLEKADVGARRPSMENGELIFPGDDLNRGKWNERQGKGACSIITGASHAIESDYHARFRRFCIKRQVGRRVGWLRSTTV